MNWYQTCAYDDAQKRRFHRSARAQLRRLVRALGFLPDTYDLRSNPGGIAVSGEVTLHHETVYVQVSQPALGGDNGILIRRCAGRRDYVGERNHFAALRMLEALPDLARCVRQVMAASPACCADQSKSAVSER